jgi:hypothetical protein
VNLGSGLVIADDQVLKTGENVPAGSKVKEE